MCDCFTKWTEAVPLPDQEATTVAQAFVDNYVSHFGTPLQLHTDRGSNFESKIFMAMCEMLQIDKTRTTVMRPQSNGNIERFHRTLATMLTMYCENDQHRWDVFLPQLMMAYRSSVHASTGQTPNRMTLGRDITLPIHLVVGKPTGDKKYEGTAAYVDALQQKLEEVHKLARKQLKRSSYHQKRNYDLRARKRPIPIGQPVWVYQPARKVGICPKMTSPWKGPYLVIKRLDDVTYKIKKSKTSPGLVTHIDRLATYKGTKMPAWMVQERDSLSLPK